MKPESGYKYLVNSDKDQMWGITVDTVGSETVPPGYEVYPPRVGHPSGFYFDVGKGRVLESYQLLYITSGRGGLLRASARTHRDRGRGHDPPAPQPLAQLHARPRNGMARVLIGFRGPNVDARFRNDFFADDLELFRVGVREEMVDLYDKAREVAEDERSSYQQYLAGIANLLLGMAMYYHANHQFVSQEVVGQIDRARRIMREEYSTGISPGEVARRVNMSYSWFRKMFRDYTNLSPARYMQQLRLQEACRLLSGTSLSIKEIAFRVNCVDASYFSNLFRRHLRMTPVEYRNRFGVGREPSEAVAVDEVPET